MICLEKEELSARLEQAPEKAKIIRISVVTKDRRSDDVIETFGRKLSGKVCGQYHFHIRKFSLCGQMSQVGVEDGRGDRISALEHIVEMRGPQTAPGSQFENCLARQQMEAVPDRDCPPR